MWYNSNFTGPSACTEQKRLGLFSEIFLIQWRLAFGKEESGVLHRPCATAFILCVFIDENTHNMSHLCATWLWANIARVMRGRGGWRADALWTECSTQVSKGGQKQLSLYSATSTWGPAFVPWERGGVSQHQPPPAWKLDGCYRQADEKSGHLSFVLCNVRVWKRVTTCLRGQRNTPSLSKQPFRPVRCLRGGSPVSLHNKTPHCTEKEISLNIFIIPRNTV